VMGYFICGVLWGKYRDPSIGWTVSIGVGQLIIGYMTIMLACHFRTRN
jgi:hypothetical protein